MTRKLCLSARTLLVPVSVALSPFAFVTSAAAQSALAAPAAGQAETIVITATRTPTRASRVGSSVTVIDTPAIARAQSIPVIDLLRDVPGVAFSRTGGVGSLTTVRIRGAESDQTVLLIDGVKLNDPSGPGGGFNFANLLVGNLERIEVLRGPQSTLYGSQAMGGVVQIITRSGDVPFGASVTLEGGDLNTKRARGSVRGQFGDLSYVLAAGQFETDGVSSAKAGKERDGYKNTLAQSRLDYAFNDHLSLEARVFWSDSEVGIDGFPAPSFVLADTLERSKTEELIVYTGANLTLLDGRSRTRFGISETQTDRTNLNPTLAVQNTFVGNGTNRRAEFQSSLDVTPQFQIVGGGEFEQSRLRTASPSVSNPNPNPLRAKSELSALYLQGQASPASWLTATLGVRWTDHDSFGEALNTRATLAASLNQGNTIVRAALADGFKSPTPFQLFSNFGNAKLQPEEASSVEIGVEQAWFSRRLIGSITYFQRDTVNQIDFVSCFGNTAAICVGRPSGTYDNIARTKADGTEFTLEAKPTPQLSLSAGFATLDARNKVRGTANFNRLLPRRAKETGFTTIGYVFDFGLDVSATYSRIGDSFNNASNTVVIKGYDLVTLRASQKVNAHWTVFARVENAGDEIYETITGYGSPRRQTLVGLRATF
ncbi:MAG: TonB-dependent receptor plug domain-containing protein [Hyphomonadaceae bacterium]|jgi:vitamin B12 transporter